MQHPSQKQYTLRNGKVFGGGTLLACCPLVSADLDALRTDTEATCKAFPDILEWRADYFEKLSDPEAVAEAARVVRVAAGDVPVLFTPRITAEGGKQDLEPEAKKAVIRAVCETGCIDLIDIEMRWNEDFIRDVRAIADASGVRLVLSYHDFKGMPDLDTIREKLEFAEKYADINKLALMPQNFHDVAAFCKMIVEAKQNWMQNPVIGSLMGDIGAVTRFGGGSLGTDMCFVAVTGVSGPGQMHIDDYRILNELIDG
ncbi:MAG: type I 3-dehydroquinate dehydratase [Clostridia bacterium]|nr:type I 3-dehydroquinate dehydratase [Clostridia bacterium]